MKLSDRLRAAADLVRKGNSVTDIGCDHGFLSICLVSESRAPFAVAADLREGPLLRARSHIEEAGLKNKITTVLCDGVPKNIETLLSSGWKREEKSSGAGKIHRNTLVLTGMGGFLILKILQDAGELLCNFSELILSPQSDEAAVRRYICANGFLIEDEKMILEDGKYYVMIQAAAGTRAAKTERAENKGGTVKVLTRAEEVYGPVLLRKKDAVLYRFLVKRRGILSDIDQKLEAAGYLKGSRRRQEISEEMMTLEEAAAHFS